MHFTINQLSAIIAIIVFIGIVIYKYKLSRVINLSDIVIAGIAGGMLPLAFCFVLYPFYPQLIGAIDNISMQITLTGLILIFVYTKTIIDKLRNDP